MASTVSFMGSVCVPSILSNTREFMADICEIKMWREECVALHLSLNPPGNGSQSKISLFAKRICLSAREDQLFLKEAGGRGNKGDGIFSGQNAKSDLRSEKKMVYLYNR